MLQGIYPTTYHAEATPTGGILIHTAVTVSPGEATDLILSLVDALPPAHRLALEAKLHQVNVPIVEGYQGSH